MGQPMNTETPDTLARLGRLLKKATPGPWGFARADRNSGNRPWITQNQNGAATGAPICLMQPPLGVTDLKKQPWPPDHQIYDNAALLTAAVNALPALIEVCEAARAFMDDALAAPISDRDHLRHYDLANHGGPVGDLFNALENLETGGAEA